MKASVVAVAFGAALIGMVAGIQPGFAETEDELFARDEKDPVVNECVTASGHSHMSVVAGAKVDRARSDKTIAVCGKIISDGGHSIYWQATAYRAIGDEYSDRGAFTEALDALNKSLTLKAGECDVVMSRGETYEKAGDTEHAISDYEWATRLPSLENMCATLAYHKLGLVYNRLQQYDLAIAYLTKGLEKSPDEVKSSLYKSRGQVWSNKGDSEKAQADFAKALDAGR